MIYEHFNLITRTGYVGGLTCLDLGCGDYHSDVARQVLDLPFKSLTAVDIYEPYLKIVRKKKSKAEEFKVVKSNVLDVKGEYDIVLCFDVLEHLIKEDGEKLLDNIEKMAKKRIVLLVPREPDGFHRHWDMDDNKYQEHISHWREQDFIKRGYEVETINSVHTEYDDKEGRNITFGGIWATKNIA